MAPDFEINLEENNSEETTSGLNLEQGVDLNIETPSSNDVEVIAELQPSMFTVFNKILSFLSQGMTSQDIFLIENGILSSNKSAGIVYSNMKSLFGENSIEIIDPANAVKLMNLIKGGEKILFAKDNVENNYIISTLVNGEPDRIITIPIPEINEADISEIPELKDIIEIEIDPTEAEDIINAFKITNADYYILNLDENYKLLSIELNNKKFKQNLAKGKVSKKFKIFDLLLVSKPDTFKIKILKDNNDNLWLSTISDIDIVEIQYFEKLQEYTEFDAFSL